MYISVSIQAKKLRRDVSELGNSIQMDFSAIQQ